MKRKLLSVILSSAMIAALLTGCGGGSSTPDTAADAGSETTEGATEENTESAEEAADTTEESTEESTEEAAVPAGDGSVYLLNFKPESDQQWKDLAAIYTEQTGVEVNVLTAAEGTYSTTMQAEMEIGRAHV